MSKGYCGLADLIIVPDGVISLRWYFCYSYTRILLLIIIFANFF